MKVFFRKNIYLVFMIAFSIIFLPTAISKESQGDTEFIITAIGLDFVDNEYEVSIQVFMPNPSPEYKQSLTVLSSKSEFISKAFNLTALRVGKKIGLAHCKAIIISDSVTQNLSGVLDVVINSKLNSNNIIMINTTDSAKEFLNNVGNIEQTLYFALREESYNKIYTSGTFTSIGQFYAQYLSKSGCSVIPIVDLVPVEELGSEAETPNPMAEDSGGQDEKDGAESSGGGSKISKVLNNEGRSAVIKKGKKVFEMVLEDTTAWNYFGNIAKKGYLYIKDVNDDFYKHADITLEVVGKQTKTRPYFKDGVPHYKVNIEVDFTLRELNQESMEKNEIKSIRKFLTPELDLRIREQLKEYIYNFIAKCKQHDADAVKVENEFYKYKTKEYMQYKNSEKGKQFFQNIVFEVDIFVKEQR